MATSNSIDFTINAAECVKWAFIKINVLNEGDYLADYDANLGLKFLNMMIKSWQSFANHLWVKQLATLFVQNSQREYIISTTTTDHFTADTIISTTLDAAAPLGSAAITVPDSSVFTVNDYIGIQQDNNYLHWTTVSGIPDATTVQLTAVTTYAAASGQTVFGYTNKLSLPFQVYSAVRHSILGNTDIHIGMLSYEEYFEQPSKESKATPTMWSYDRQLDHYKISLLPVPNGINDYIKFVVARKIQDIDSIANNFDFPQEWEETIVMNLAVRLAPTYGKAQGKNFDELKLQAASCLKLALCNDNELGSIYLQPSYDTTRRG